MVRMGKGAGFGRCTMQAIILAAGEGSRIRPLTRNRPKAMVPVANRPIISYVIDALLANGIRDIVVVVGYRREQVIRYLNTLSISPTVVIQEKQLGTAHALQCAEAKIHGDFIVLPGDNLVDSASIGRLLHEQNAMLIKEHPRPTNFGVVECAEGCITAVTEKPEYAPTMTVSTGVISLTQDIFAHIESTALTDVINTMVRKGICIKAYPAAEWMDAIVPWDLLTINSRLLQHISSHKEGSISRTVMLKGPVTIGKDTTIHPNTVIYGPVSIGSHCEIGPNVTILPDTSIGSRVTIKPHTLIESSLLMDDIQVGSHSQLFEAVVGEGCVLHDHLTTQPFETIYEIEGEVWKASFGAVLGDNVRTAPFTVLKNCIVGNDTTIQNGRVVTGILPDSSLVL
jgi:UDP-N-acetylglucosamine diphosphorylase/glucosamine-1-phosphate N-acetyltransferase